MQESNLVVPEQFGFRSKLSSNAAVAQFTDKILDCLSIFKSYLKYHNYHYSNFT